MRTYGLVLTRSDAGDGGWSLHPAGTTDQQIADGLVEPLLTGEAELVGGEWNRPGQADYNEAVGDDPGAHNDPQADPVLILLDAARAALAMFGPGGTDSPLEAQLRSAIAAASEYVGGAPDK